MIDLRGFKSVNDTYGMTVGDATLAMIGQRLRETAGDDSVFRSGGDEFFIVGRFATEEELSHFAAQLRSVIEAPIGDVIVRVAMAGARANGPGADLERLILNCDLALDRVRRENSTEFLVAPLEGY